jgi:hypothetical protein
MFEFTTSFAAPAPASAGPTGRDGFTQAGDEHHRVKAKALLADRLAGNLALHPAHGNQRLRVLRAADCHQGADQSGAAVSVQCHLLQHSAAVVVVRLGVTKLDTVVGRVDPGQAAKGINAQPRIIGNGRQTGMQGRVTRFGKRIFDKGVVRLGGFGHAQLALRNQLHAQRCKQRPQLGQLAGVVGCKHYFHGSTLPRGV